MSFPGCGQSSETLRLKQRVPAVEALVGVFLCCSTGTVTWSLSSARPSASACAYSGTHGVEATALFFVLFIPERFSGLLVA